MGYTKRIRTLCSHFIKMPTFADVGCDHGYCTQYALQNGLCENAIFSDVSKGSLQKAEVLLQQYVQDGKAVGVLGDGFFGVPSTVDQVIIAGMGGQEIISILKDEKYGFIPKRFILQPMHDTQKLREYLIEKGANILHDYTFFDGKFYDVIVGEYPNTKGKCSYTDIELAYGKDNIKTRNDAFIKRLQKQIENTKKYLSGTALQEESKKALQEKLQQLQGVLRGDLT